MLDEIKEVESYLTKPQTDNPRIQPKLFSEVKDDSVKLYGISEYLTIICRYYLYNYSTMKDNCCDENVRTNAKLIMRAWCGFSGDLSEDELKKVKTDNEKWFQDYPKADGWLRAYHKKHLKNIASWDDYSSTWKEHLNNDLIYRRVGNCYETILAEAIAQGPLKIYYLTMKKDYEDISFTKPEGKGNISKPTKNKIIKFIATYMLQTRFHPEQKWVVAPKLRMLNWLGYDTNKHTKWFPEVLWNGENPFGRVSENNIAKITVNQNFINDMGIKITATKPKEIHNEYNVYYDTGYGKKSPIDFL